MNILEEDIYAVQAAMEQWSDSRVISAGELESLLLFLFYVPKTLSQNGVHLLGYSFRHKDGRYLMTSKALEGQVPIVVFVTSDSPTGCIFRFLNLLEDDRLSWRKDRYPWI